MLDCQETARSHGRAVQQILHSSQKKPALPNLGLLVARIRNYISVAKAAPFVIVFDHPSPMHKAFQFLCVELTKYCVARLLMPSQWKTTKGEMTSFTSVEYSALLISQSQRLEALIKELNLSRLSWEGILARRTTFLHSKIGSRQIRTT